MMRFVPVLVLWVAGCAASLPPLVVSPAETSSAQGTLFVGVRLFDGTDVHDSRDVLVLDGRVAEIAAGGTLTAPPLVETVDGTARTLLPGLWDAHVHVGGGDGSPPWASALPDTDRHLQSLVYAGVTSCVIAARSTDTIELQARVARGAVVGPRMLRGSRAFTIEDGHPLSMLRAFVPWIVRWAVVSAHVRSFADEDEAREEVREEIEDDHPDFVKIMFNAIPVGTARMTAEHLAALIDEAKKHDTRVFVHVGTPDEAVTAAEGGADLLMHTPWTREFTDEEIERVKATGVPMVTTRQIYGVIGKMARGTSDFTQLERESMRPGVLDAFAAGPGDWRSDVFDEAFARRAVGFDVTLGKNLVRLHAAGVRLFAGTDCGVPGILQGAGLHRELRALVALGIPTLDVLRMATSAPAAFFDPRSNSGTVRVGSVGDLLLVEGDPTTDIAATENIVGVWQAGRRVGRRPPVGP